MLVGWLVGWLADWLVGRSVGRSVGWLVMAETRFGRGAVALFFPCESVVA